MVFFSNYLGASKLKILNETKPNIKINKHYNTGKNPQLDTILRRVNTNMKTYSNKRPCHGICFCLCVGTCIIKESINDNTEEIINFTTINTIPSINFIDCQLYSVVCVCFNLTPSSSRFCYYKPITSV